MQIIKTEFEDVLLLIPDVFKDQRGFFMESYNKEELNKLGVATDFVQDNLAYSAQQGTLRGLHYQALPKTQVKLVMVPQGEIFDVVVDMRRDSPDFGKWIATVLSAENRHMLFVPPGFVHGYCTLRDETTVMYKVDEYYSPEHDRGIRWNDPDLNIQWPVQQPILSEKDKTLPCLKDIAGL